MEEQVNDDNFKCNSPKSKKKESEKSRTHGSKEESIDFKEMNDSNEDPSDLEEARSKIDTENVVKNRFHPAKTILKSHSVESSSCQSSSVGEIDQKVMEVCSNLRDELVSEFRDQIQGILESAVDRVIAQSETTSLASQPDLLKYNMSDKTQWNSGSDEWLPEKKFCHRNSVLTDLFKISHIETVYHIFVAVLMISALNTVMSDMVELGGLVHLYHLELFFWTFGGISKALQCWFMMFLSTSIGVYLAFMLWASRRRNVCRFTKFDLVAAILYVMYQAAFVMLPVIFILNNDLAPSSSTLVCMEQIRLLMKSHAFVRTNVGAALLTGDDCEREKLRFKQHQSNNSEERFPVSACVGDRQSDDGEDITRMCNGLPIPPFSNYLYFLFAPTLVYRCSYPRTPYIRWRFVALNLLQMALCIIYTYFIFVRFCFSYFQDFGRSENFSFSLRQLIKSSFGCMLPGALLLLINFYALLHCWLNAFAEMFRFGDRLFYKDWWNSVTFSAYYRTWNVVVHDWLYTYVYRDVYALGGKHRRILAQTAVFMLSAFFHEYVLTLVFRFFYPVLFVVFGGVGFAISNLRGRSRLWNIGLWVSLFMGMGILMCLYSMEWYARKNCPPTQGLLDLFVPRSWFCGS